MNTKNLLSINCPVCGNEVYIHNRKAKRCEYCGCSFVKQGNKIKILDMKGTVDYDKEKR